MVQFNWSWDDYHRLVKREERARARQKSRATETVAHEPEQAPPAKPTTITPAAPEHSVQLQDCRACGKRRLEPCTYGGCPIL